jgi:RsiW-degrading membrane proteinase PrsW (M82 family)
MSLNAPNYPAAPTVGGAPAVPPYPATLVIQGSAWRSAHAYGSQAPLFKPRTYIGKLGSNDIVLSDPYASRVHAAIYWTPQGYEIEDLRSTNGVFVNGVRINGRAALTPGQVIHIGHTDMTFYALQGAAWPSQYAALNTPTPPPHGSWGPAAAAPTVLAPVAPFQHPGAEPSLGARVSAWMSAEWRKRYWKVFLVGLGLLIFSEYLLNGQLGLAALWLVVPIAAALMPVSFFIYCWDSDYLADMPRWIPWVTFFSGAFLGVTLAFILERIFITSESFTDAMLVGLIEESCKALAVIWFIRNRKLRSEIDGVILGAAAGAGFATLETIGYALTAYFGGFSDGGGLAALNATLLLRGLLAIFGHVTWTAIVVGAIWRDRGQSSFKLTFGVIFAFAVAVTLHGLWDGVPYLGVLLAALIGSWLMRFFLREAVAREKMGAMAPPPPPLLVALGTYLVHPFRDPLPQAPAPAPAMFSGSWSVAPTQVWSPAPAYQPAPGAPPRARICANGHQTTNPTARYCRMCGAPLIS